MYLQYTAVYLKLPSRSLQPIILCLADSLDIPLRFVLSANIYLPCNWFLPGSSPTSTNSNTHNRLLSWSSWDHLRSTRWLPGPPNAGASCTFDFCLPFMIFSLLLIRIHLTTCKRGFMFSKIIFLHWLHFYNLWYCTIQVLQTLTDAAVPSKELTSSIKNIYSKTKVVAHF